MLHTINLRCHRYHLRVFSLDSRLFDDDGVYILPVRSRSGNKGDIVKATPVFKCKLREVLK